LPILIEIVDSEDKVREFRRRLGVDVCFTGLALVGVLMSGGVVSSFLSHDRARA
jgi:hypothetical protein